MTIRIAAILTLLCAALPVGAQVYKCTQGGKTVFQDSPCDGSIPRPATPPPTAKSSSPEASLERPMPDQSGMMLFLLIYSNCTHMFPDLHAKSAMNYQAWRLKNSTAVSRIESSPEFQEGLKRNREEAAAKLQQPGMREPLRTQCSDMVLTAFGPPPVANGGKTPAEAWSGFMSALRAADVERAVAFVAPGSRGRYRETLKADGSEGMRSLAHTYGDLKIEMRVSGDLAFGKLVRSMPDGSAPYEANVKFMRDPQAGGWFIESMM